MAFWLDPVVVLVSQVSLGLVFAASAFSKLRALEEFVGIVENYRVLPGFAVRPVAYVLPAVEAGIAAGLVLGPTRPYAAIGAVALLTVFSLAMGINLIRGRREVDCGCFGPLLKQTLSWWLVARNGVLILMASICIPEGLPIRPMYWLDVLTGVAGAIGVTILYLSASYLFSRTPAISR